MQELTKATLDEVPRQLLDFMNQKGIKPLPEIGQNVEELQKAKEDEDDFFKLAKEKFKSRMISKGFDVGRVLQFLYV